MAIEGNTLNLDQVTALIEGKSVIGSQREIREVLNAIDVYDQMQAYDANNSASLRKAHRMMMGDLLNSAGAWRSGNVGIFKGTAVSHIAPPADRVPHLMEELFQFLKEDKHHTLIKSAVFHYELEFIHPFEDGNGRLGRFWHSLLLTRYHPIFEYTPVESLIREHQSDYYEALGHADRVGDSTQFIEFSLDMVFHALENLMDAIRPEPATAETRLERAKGHFGDGEFTRKDYLKLFKGVSTATASRDLKAGVDGGHLRKHGERALTRYRFSR
ncbi:MAG: Fic family protein [Puniceicoccales bacterium]